MNRKFKGITLSGLDKELYSYMLTIFWKFTIKTL